jgi:phosphatidylglycerol:prolipoprotein diacylglycerol transferase
MVCDFSNIAFSICGWPVYWYSLAYIFGILLAFKLTEFFAKKTGARGGSITREMLEEFINYAVIGIIVGGRLGHVLLYDFTYYIEHCSEILKIWKGGMSFFGGFIGVVCAAFIFCRKSKINFLRFIDLWAISAPVGLFLGRIANFINGELLGKESNVAWNVVFYDGVPRHPSQIYEAILEGALLFAVMVLSFYGKCHKNDGQLSGIFCCGYGIARFMGEFFREPDSLFSREILLQTGINFNQCLSIAIFVFGACLIYRSLSKKLSTY